MKIVVASHGAFCHGLVESYKMIAGDNSDIYAVSLTDEGIGEFSRELSKLVDKLILEDDILIMTDIQGGTPYNESLKYMLDKPENIKVISGMNLPMLIEIGLALNNDMEIDQLVNRAVEIGRKSINVANIDIDDEDDLDL